jgi:hypothetical protein
MKVELRYRVTNSISKFDHHNISGGAVSTIHDVTGRRLVSSIYSWDIYGGNAYGIGNKTNKFIVVATVNIVRIGQACVPLATGYGLATSLAILASHFQPWRTVRKIQVRLTLILHAETKKSFTVLYELVRLD